MSTYLDQINEKTNLEQYNDWYIDNFFWWKVKFFT